MTSVNQSTSDGYQGEPIYDDLDDPSNSDDSDMTSDQQLSETDPLNLYKTPTRYMDSHESNYFSFRKGGTPSYRSTFRYSSAELVKGILQYYKKHRIHNQ